MSEHSVAIEIWSGERWNEVAPIGDLVYPPENPITKVWRQVTWSHPQQRVVVLVDDQPVCHVGIYFRDGTANGTATKICGIGGVMTRPEHQGRHYATRALAIANDIATEHGREFGVLVCEDKNIALYRKFGWRVFPGQMIYQVVKGEGGAWLPDAAGNGAKQNAVWSLSPVMVRDITAKAPADGNIDLCGMPW